MDIYYQPDYTGAAVDTCQYYASSHHGDVRKCYGPRRVGLLAVEANGSSNTTAQDEPGIVKPDGGSDTTVQLDGRLHGAYLLQEEQSQVQASVPDGESPFKGNEGAGWVAEDSP